MFHQLTLESCLSASFQLGKMFWSSGLIAKHVRHAPTARRVLSTRAYEEPCWHYKNRKTFLAIGACPTCFAIIAFAGRAGNVPTPLKRLGNPLCAEDRIRAHETAVRWHISDIVQSCGDPAKYRHANKKCAGAINKSCLISSCFRSVGEHRHCLSSDTSGSRLQLQPGPSVTPEDGGQLVSTPP